MAFSKRDIEVLAKLAALSAEAAQLVYQLRGKAGRPLAPEIAFRRLALLWLSYRRQNPELIDKLAAAAFLRRYRRHISREFGLSRNTPESLRKAISRGAKETYRVNSHRRQTWRVESTVSLADWIAGRRRHLMTDPDKAALEKHHMVRALGLKP